ncbi:MAG: DegV family protein [Firmicutes bacterium]|nr:DegV family protein [Bacillota bacterium]
MAQIKIVTDSTADLPNEVIKKYDIKVVPLKVNFAEESLKDRVEIMPNEFYKRFTNEKSIPSTSQPSPGEFQNVYQSLADEGYCIISIHLSTDLSGTYQAAQLARSMLPNANIKIFDSRTVSVGLALLVLTAARAAQEGKSFPEIISLVEQTIPKIKIYFIVDTLEYLAKGGRIGHATAFLGSLLNIKPLLAIYDGEIHPVEKVRGRKKAVSRLVQMVKSETNNYDSLYYFAHAGNENLFNNVLEKAEAENIICKEMLLLGELGPVVGCHSGPGAVGIAFLKY